jgi:hypothetical protein
MYNPPPSSLCIAERSSVIRTACKFYEVSASNDGPTIVFAVLAVKLLELCQDGKAL